MAHHAAWASLQAAWASAQARLEQADARQRAVVAAAAVAAAAGATVLVVRRRRRRVQARTAAEQAAEAEQAAAAHTGAGEAITSLEQLRELAGRAAAVRVLFAAPRPVLRVAVAHHGAALPALPPAVCRLRELRELDLRGNALEALPPALGRLTALTTLNVSSNRLAALPDSIGDLGALVELDVGGNALTALPPSLGRLARLRLFNAAHNALAALPDSFGGLAALHRCGLKANALAELPPSFGQLTSLVELYLTDNRLVALPPEMGNLTKLVKLQASFNRLRSLPAELGQLPQLEMLRVASCEIAEVPAALAHAPKLAWMSLASNPACRRVSPKKPPVVQLADLQLGPKLGDGASGEVFAGSWMGRRVAVKIFVKDRSPDGHSRDEMAIAFSVSERHLVRVVAQLQEPLGLVMEFAEGQPIADKPNLHSLLRCRWAPGQTFQLGWVVRVAVGVAQALEHMHYRGICHGDVYAHNVMADEGGHATLCDYGASFPYHKGGRVPYEAQEVRAFGLMLADMVQRLDIGFEGMEAALEAQRKLLRVVQQCTTGPPADRPSFGVVGHSLRTILRAVAKAGLGDVTARSDIFTPRTSISDASSLPRSSPLKLP